MSDLGKRLRPNRDDVVSKVIEGEAIVINLSNGIYYSMDGVAGLIWNLIAEVRSLDEILGAIMARYDVTRSQAESDVNHLVAQLLEEKLIEASDEEMTGLAPPDGNGVERLAYTPPALNIYRDMGDLLALDPPQPGLENTPWRATGDAPSGEGQ
jgi:hypothetical protein